MKNHPSYVVLVGGSAHNRSWFVFLRIILALFYISDRNAVLKIMINPEAQLPTSYALGPSTIFAYGAIPRIDIWPFWILVTLNNYTPMVSIEFPSTNVSWSSFEFFYSALEVGWAFQFQLDESWPRLSGIYRVSVTTDPLHKRDIVNDIVC